VFLVDFEPVVDLLRLYDLLPIQALSGYRILVPIS
jgi:hypothetical protein